MIYHEMFSQHLRAGNWLFKYAWSIAKKEQFAEVSCYPDYYLWQYLRWPPYIGEQPEEFQFLKANWEWSEDEEKRVDSIIRTNRNVVVSLDSFFQSEKWFENYKSNVWQGLKFKDDVVRNIEVKYNHLMTKPTIGLGIRLGDFVGHGDFYQIKPEWYIDALMSQPFWSNHQVVVFSDDIVKAKEIFKDWDFEYAEPNGTHTHADNFKYYHGDASEQLILGSLMDNWIIGNSTFSWWQAWLAEQNSLHSSCMTKCKVIHSGKVFSDTGNMKHINTEYYYPKSWIKYDI